MSGFDVALVVGARGLKRLPPDVRRAVVRTNGTFRVPAGWREVPGAMHQGRGVWFIPVERVSAEGDEHE